MSIPQARVLHLAAQGLLQPPRRRATRAALLDAIERMQLLQIDTIHVVARSPYLVLFSRVGKYAQDWLDELLASAEIFECWAHEACFAPTRDFILHRSARGQRAGHWAIKRAARVHAENRADLDWLLAHVREFGPVKTSDFESERTGSGGWWGWKDEKHWLEACFALGELMITRREKFHRVYDLSERVIGRVLPDWNGVDFPPHAVQREYILRSVRALGVTQARWIADYFRSGRRHGDADLDEYVRAGDLLRVTVAGWDVHGYVHVENLDLARSAAAGKLRATHTTLLSPFDPVVWDRARASVLFGFDYTIECYTPAAKRRYGYFVLPILRRGQLIGRLDAKAHREAGEFEIKSIYLESDIAITDALVRDLANAIQSCAAWHQTPRVVIRRSEPGTFAKPLRVALHALR
ncbi:MAG: crosslink repair DNA glycosylase YcaQ family protein [Dokdonella sp.]